MCQLEVSLSDLFEVSGPYGGQMVLVGAVAILQWLVILGSD